MKGKIKLVVSDMDGTLLNDQHELHPDFFYLYEKLKVQNILFVPASGRQYYSILHYFEPIKNEIAIIAENGSYVTYKDEVLFTDELGQQKVRDIILAIRKISGANIVVCGAKHAYVESKEENFKQIFAQFYYQNQLVEDVLTALQDDRIIKIAVHHPINAEEYLYPALANFNHEQLKVVVSGPYWIDIMNVKTNKGNALQNLQKKLGIKPEETLVFGDYLNDLEMLQNATYSYAMDNAHPLVKAQAKYTAKSNNDYGVIEILRQLVD
ncbi:Cof-type HAD-IIB family hydrolase [Vaginella massiliensis]|uniref:Cof-type HAD-IIB family hydrolase n=1 Tax=Vaginella massiliensis TaxID=1816680 RepID=UPI00083999CC|nr:Cof-type HAD-IIB family hydrolase [Vaginella massiliensis]